MREFLKEITKKVNFLLSNKEKEIVQILNMGSFNKYNT